METTQWFQLRHHVWPARDELAVTHILPEFETCRKLEGIKWESLQLPADENSSSSWGGSHPTWKLWTSCSMPPGAAS